MRTILALTACVLLAACSHTPPPAPVPVSVTHVTPVTAPPSHPAPKPVAPHAVVAPTPVARPQMPDDRTPEHVCTDLAKRRAEDAATLGEDAKGQQAVRDKVYAVCIGSAKNPVP